MLHVRPDIVPIPGQLVFRQIDLVRDVLVCHGVVSFHASVPGKQKKTFVPQEPIPNGPLGQKSENFCGATQIGEKLARSATCYHTSFLGNGGKTRRYLLALRRSVRPRQSIGQSRLCCHPTTGSSLGETRFAYSSASSVCCFELVRSLHCVFWICQE